MTGRPIVDLMQKVDEPAPQCGQRVLCRHPYEEAKRAFVKPANVEKLYRTYWEDGQVRRSLLTLLL